VGQTVGLAGLHAQHVKGGVGRKQHFRFLLDVRQRLQVVDVAAGRLTVLALLEQQLVANLQATASKSKATPLATQL